MYSTWTPRHGALERLAQLEGEHGPLPPTRVNLWGRGDGGQHRWFLHPAARCRPPALARVRKAGPGQTADTLRTRIDGQVPTAATVHTALCELEAAGLATRQASDGAAPYWSAAAPSCDDTLAALKLRGPHDLRHTFSTWLEDAGIPAGMIDELMGHAGGRGGGGEEDRRGR